MKILKSIPNTITSMNVLCGVLGLIQAFNGNNDIAFYFMLAGAVFDFCDGLAARALDAYSPMGKELDSLADLITFGLLPSIMLYRCMEMVHPGQWFCYISLIIVVFSALRLAKFNVDDRQSENFIGLATPACAMICGSFATIVNHDSINFTTIIAEYPWLIPVVSCVLSVLLVSEIPMFSMKFKKNSAYNKIRMYFIIFVAAIAIASFILNIYWAYIILMTFTCYILMNIVKAIS